MKIEIAEQMIASYLKNIEGCEIVQTNWKPSSLIVNGIFQNDKKISIINDIIDEIKCNNEFSNLNIFKKNKTIQLIRQAEVDVVGLRVNIETKKCFLIDSAFHENGLRYNVSNVEKVLMKLIRQFICGFYFFEDYDCYIAFYTPKLSNSDEIKINKYIKMFVQIIENHFKNKYEIKLVTNDDYKQILYDLLNEIPQIKDDNDLFSRAILLSSYFDKNKSINNSKKVNNVKSKAPSGYNKSLIINGFNDLLKKGLITNEIINCLLEKGYTYKNFKIPSYSFLIKENEPDIPINRYYNEIIEIEGIKYRICSQWIPNRMELFDIWKKELEKKL